MKLLLINLLSISIFANEMKQNMFNLYQNKKYKEVCTLGFDNFKNYTKDEEFISLYAFSCLNSDYIDNLTLWSTATQIVYQMGVAVAAISSL